MTDKVFIFKVVLLPMKKKTVIIISFLIFVFFASSKLTVNAQVDSFKKPQFRTFSDQASGSASSGKSGESKNASIGANIKEKVDVKRKELILRFLNRMLDRLEAAIKRLEILSSRIDNRLVKLKAAGVNTAIMEGENAAVKDKLTQARKDLVDLRASGAGFLGGSDPKTGFITVKQKIGLLRDEVKGVHQALVVIVTQIKGLRTGAGEATNSSKLVKPTFVPTISPLASPSASL